MRLLFLGDVVGRTGRNAVTTTLPGLRERLKLDFVVVNGENAAGGFGITEAILERAARCRRRRRDARQSRLRPEGGAGLHRAPGRVCSGPSTIPPGTPGRGAGLFKARNGADVLVINAMGRMFMAELDDPFRAIDARAHRLPAEARRRRHRHRLPRRGDEREAGARPLRRRAREPS